MLWLVRRSFKLTFILLQVVHIIYQNYLRYLSILPIYVEWTKFYNRKITKFNACFLGKLLLIEL